MTAAIGSLPEGVWQRPDLQRHLHLLLDLKIIDVDIQDEAGNLVSGSVISLSKFEGLLAALSEMRDPYLAYVHV